MFRLKRGALVQFTHRSFIHPLIHEDAPAVVTRKHALARRVQYHVDPDFPGPGRFKGAVTVTLKDGRSLVEVEEYNRGSAENPMTSEELRAKFDDNAGSVLDAAARSRLADAVATLESLDDVGAFVAAHLS